LGLLAEGSFFKGQYKVGPRVAAALHPAAPSSAANIHAEEVAEDVAENVADIGEIRRVKTA
jgi:hypothetical protein